MSSKATSSKAYDQTGRSRSVSQISQAELCSIVATRIQELASELNRIAVVVNELQEEGSAMHQHFLGTLPYAPPTKSDTSRSMSPSSITSAGIGLHEDSLPSDRSHWSKVKPSERALAVVRETTESTKAEFTDDSLPPQDSMSTRALFKGTLKPMGDRQPLAASVEGDSRDGDDFDMYGRAKQIRVSFRETSGSIGDIDDPQGYGIGPIDLRQDGRLSTGYELGSDEESESVYPSSRYQSHYQSSHDRSSKYSSEERYQDRAGSEATAGSISTKVPRSSENKSSILSRKDSRMTDSRSTSRTWTTAPATREGEEPRGRNARRQGRKYGTQAKTYAPLPQFAVKGYEDGAHRKSSHLYSTGISATEKNFRLVVAQLSEKEKLTHGVLNRSPFCSSKLQPFVMSPMSRKSLSIDMVAVALIVYDCGAVPMLLLDAKESKDEGLRILQAIAAWFARIFWTLAIGKSFLTGYLREDGAIETNAAEIARDYSHTWLALDILIVLADWVDAFSQQMAAGGVARVIRLLKAARLARLLRIPNIIVRKLNHASSERMLLWLSIIKNTVAFVMLNHFLACIWYYIGDMRNDGWVSRPDYDNLGESNMWNKYSYAVHWSASQFIGSTQVMPSNLLERGFGASVMIGAFIWSASFISRITAAMTRLQILSGQKGMLFSSLRQFLSSNGISEQLGIRVLASAKYLVAEKDKNQQEEDIELLNMLSEPLLIEIHYEVHASHLNEHPFFRRYNHFEPLAIQKLCHSAVKVLHLATGDVLFAQGEEPTDPRMFFVLTGILLYIKDFDGDGCVDADEMVEVTKPMWVCEPVLWVKWTHAGHLRAASHCSVLALSAAKFGSVISDYRNTSYPAQYAAQITNMMNLAQKDDDVDDLCENIDTRQLVQRVFPHYLDKKTFLSGSKHGSQLFGRSVSHLNLNNILQKTFGRGHNQSF